MEATTITAPVGKVFRAVKTKLNGEDALNALRAMSARRDEIAAKYAAVLAECKKVQAEAEAAERDFSNNPSAGLVRKLVVLRPQAGVATEIFGAFYRTHGARVNDEFLAEHKKILRDVMLRAAKHLLEKAQKAFNVELARSRETLTREEFDLEEVEQAPRVRRAKREVEKFERLVEGIKQSAEEHLWQNAATILK